MKWPVSVPCSGQKCKYYTHFKDWFQWTHQCNTKGFSQNWALKHLVLSLIPRLTLTLLLDLPIKIEIRQWWEYNQFLKKNTMEFGLERASTAASQVLARPERNYLQLLKIFMAIDQHLGRAHSTYHSTDRERRSLFVVDVPGMTPFLSDHNRRELNPVLMNNTAAADGSVASLICNNPEKNENALQAELPNHVCCTLVPLVSTPY